MLFNRWSKVGSKGQDKLSDPYTSIYSATLEFESKFYDKTRDNWCDRQNFVAHPKRYTWLEMDYNKTDQEPAVSCPKAGLVFLDVFGRLTHSCMLEKTNPGTSLPKTPIVCKSSKATSKKALISISNINPHRTGTLTTS